MYKSYNNNLNYDFHFPGAFYSPIVDKLEDDGRELLLLHTVYKFKIIWKVIQEHLER